MSEQEYTEALEAMIEHLEAELAESRQEGVRLRDALEETYAKIIEKSFITANLVIEKALSATPSTKAYAEKIAVMQRIVDTVLRVDGTDLSIAFDDDLNEYKRALARLEEVRKA